MHGKNHNWDMTKWSLNMFEYRWSEHGLKHVYGSNY